ncbi:MAG: M28 family metallopeptidase [Candidatus Odinarchaeota archaeon]
MQIETQLVDSISTSENLQRVYGVNLASEIYREVSQGNYEEYIQELSEFGPRYVMTYDDKPGSPNEQARLWLVDKLANLSSGRLEIELMGNYQNIVARLPGYLPDDSLPVFIVSAHYDTVASCPGANDDGSGIATVLELARVMSHYDWPLDIYFIAFNGDHSLGGIQGGKEVANAFQQAEIKIMAMYNIDTILYVSRNAPRNERVLLAYGSGDESVYHLGQYWAELAKTLSNYYGRDAVGIVASNEFSYWESSDHYEFFQRGYRGALCAFESGYAYDSFYRTYNDVYDRDEYRYYIGAETTAFVGASMAFTMGRAYGQKPVLTDSLILLTGVSTEYYIPISTTITINVTSRWYGGGANFLLYNPNGILIGASLYTTGHPWTPTQVLSTSVSQKGLYKLEVWNAATSSIGADMYVEYDSDIDGNDIFDSQEYWFSTELFSIDSDNDTLSNAMEIIYGTDSNSADTDQDTMPDAYEIEMGFDPRDSGDAGEDTDGDTLTNAQEYYYGLNPFSSDSDSDSIPDDWELAHGLNPLVDDADENPDNDNYTNLEEYLRGSDPNFADVENLTLIWIAIPSTTIILLGIGVYIFRRN